MVFSERLTQALAIPVAIDSQRGVRPRVLPFGRECEQIAQGVPEDESGGEQVEAGFHQLFLADMQAGIADVAHASHQGNRDEPQQQFRFVIRVLITPNGSYRHEISLYSEGPLSPDASP